MALSKPSLIVSSLAAAGLAGAIALGYAAPHLAATFFAGRGGQTTVVGAAPTGHVQKVADRSAPVAPGPEAGTDREVVVNAPSTSVRVAKDSGKVAVTAPYTGVKVDPDKGRVQVRAPYVNLDIRW
jgi:hypothetical protein